MLVKMPMMGDVLQDPLSMLTRQLNSPDLDGFVGKTAFFLCLEMYHPPFDIVVVVVVAIELGVPSQRGHESCDAGWG